MKKTSFSLLVCLVWPFFALHASMLGGGLSSITVFAPHTGKTVALGESISVVWNSSDPQWPVDIKIINSDGQVLSSPIQLNFMASDITHTGQSLGFTTAESGALSLPLGQYKARVCNAGTTTDCSESGWFTIISSVTNVSPNISQVLPQPVLVGSMLTVHVLNAGRGGNVVLKTQNGLSTWSTGYGTDVRGLTGFSLYDGSTLSFWVPSTIGRGVHPDGWWNEPIVPVTAGSYSLYVTALDADNNFVQSNAVTVQVANAVPPILKNFRLNGGFGYVEAYNIVPHRFYWIESSDDLKQWQKNIPFLAPWDGIPVKFPMYARSAQFIRIVLLE